MKHPLVKSTEERMQKAIEKIHEELRKMRTGRPSPAILEEIKVDYYGAYASSHRESHLCFRSWLDSHE